MQWMFFSGYPVPFAQEISKIACVHHHKNNIKIITNEDHRGKDKIKYWLGQAISPTPNQGEDRLKHDVQNYVLCTRDQVYANIVAFQSTCPRSSLQLMASGTQLQHFHLGTLSAMFTKEGLSKIPCFLCWVALCYCTLYVFCAHWLYG